MNRINPHAQLTTGSRYKSDQVLQTRKYRLSVETRLRQMRTDRSQIEVSKYRNTDSVTAIRISLLIAASTPSQVAALLQAASPYAAPTTGDDSAGGMGGR